MGTSQCLRQRPDRFSRRIYCRSNVTGGHFCAAVDKTEAARLARELIRNDPGSIEGRTLTVKKAGPMAKRDNFGRSGRDDRSGEWNQWFSPEKNYR